MIVTHKIHMDLDRRGPMPRIDAMQDDRYCRNLEFSLYSGHAPWNPPAGTGVTVTYRKANGNGGVYDTMPDGSAAWHIRDNVLTVALAPQLCTVPGHVNLVVALFRGDAKLSTFAVLLDVERNPAMNASVEEDIISIGGFLPQVTDGAAPGQHLLISAVDEQGRVTGLQAADLPGEIPAYTQEDYGSYLTPSAKGLVWIKGSTLPAAEEASF